MDDLDAKRQELFEKRLMETANQRANTRLLVAAGRWRDAEPVVSRAQAYAAKRAVGARRGAESITGDTEDFQRAAFLPSGARRSRAVAYVEVNYGTKTELGTGFMISETLFMTNCHVIENEVAARGARISFDKELDELGRPRPETTYVLDPTRFSLFSPPTQLDYAIVAIGERLSGEATLADLGFCPLSNRPDKHQLGINCNIIGHPNGWSKMIAVRNNLLTGRTDNTLLYETDTEEGASGSPVYNDDWELIALHHWGEPFRDVNTLDPSVRRNVNEGIRISAIYNDLTSRIGELASAQRDLLTAALSFSNATQTVGNSRTLSPPRPSSNEKETLAANLPSEATMNSSTQVTSMKFTIPIEISVSIPGLVADSARAPAAVLSRTRPLTHGAEALQLDTDYSNRDGYQPNFIPGLEVKLPEPNAQLAKKVAPLRADETNFELGELKYEHFSLKLNKTKRIAMFTATNIDGATYLTVDRTSGRVNEAEGEVWFKDPRVSASFFLDQSFYSAWSTYFDRGHLTRRTDPTWGTAEQAERANADTFHFSNCSPQHFRFNQSAIYWQGLERYVLENGVLANETKLRLCVFQGPIFDDKVDLWADDVQIPSSFFKVVVWKSQSGPKAVALVVDQSKLLSEPRHGVGTPKDLKSVDVNHWRESIESIEKKSQLDFGSAVRDADTISQVGQPSVGEAKQLITRLEDIKL